MKWKRWLWAGALLTVAGAARADVPPPPKQAGKTVRIEISPTRSANGRIEIPRSVLAGGSTRAEAGFPLQPLMTGLFLSLAMIGGGLWAVRRRGTAGLTAIAAGALALATTGGVAWANLAPPPRRSVTGDVVVEVSNRSSIRVELTHEQIVSLYETLRRSGRAAGTPPAAGAPPSR